MPINLQGSGNIAEGWGPAPQLHAPEIGSLVHAILGNRLGQQKLTQESIADTIKNIQQQRESAAYTDALQKAGLLPEGDYGGLGMKGGASLATIIQRQQALEAVEAHRQAVEARIGGRGRGGGGSGGGASEPETTWDAQGREWRRAAGGRWIPMKSGAGGANMITLTDENNEPLKDADGNEIHVPAGSAVARQYLQSRYGNLNQSLTAGQATSLSKGLGVPPQDILDSTKHQGLQRVPGAVASPDVGGEGDLLPLSPDQSEFEATDVRVTPSAGVTSGGAASGPVNIPRPMLERMKRGLMGPDYGPQSQQPTTPPVQPQASASTGRPDASKGAPVNLPQVGDQRPGPNGTTIEWDGHGWKIVQ